MSIHAKHFSMEERRKLLDSSNGRIFHVTFQKADGSIREMTAKKWCEKHFTHGSKSAAPSTVAHKPEMYTCSDIGAADAFRNVNMLSLIKARVNGEDYDFTV